MARTVIAVFDTPDQARETMRDLMNNGVSRDDISLVTKDTRPEGQRGKPIGEERGTMAGEKAAAGAGIGAGVGGLAGLATGLGLLTIPGIGPVLAAGPLLASTAAGAGFGATVGAISGALLGAGVPQEEAEWYSEAIRRGGTLLTVRTSDERASEIARLMDRHNPIDIRQRAEEWRRTGWTEGMAEKEMVTGEERRMREPSTTMERERTSFMEREPSTEEHERMTMEREPSAMEHERKTSMEHEEMRGPQATMPEVQEELKVGKRQTEETAQVRSRVTEEPVSEDVRLREEEIKVQRRPVDPAATPEEMDQAFRSKTYEVRATQEEPVVQKEARVTGEVEVGKEARERVETVRDTVRRSQVEVEGAGISDIEAGFAALDDSFRSDYDQHYRTSGYSVPQQYRPIYRYGYDLATSSKYRDRDWSDIEPEARTRWEERNPGTWDRFVDAIRFGWNSGHREWQRRRAA